MLKHNTYFEGSVQSIGFERNGLAATAGVIDVGSFHFGTGKAERMTIVSGELWVTLAGHGERTYAAGTSFEVAANSGFDVRATAPVAYLCEFLGE
ncbi:MAG TPA: pyrimidine/purine nucleoside phosphorylase [Candidatus Binatia bacterium]|nr:pyrimidine/purine nucleoside phosphorylase [Candidatus Binatia bacterium]